MKRSIVFPIILILLLTACNSSNEFDPKELKDGDIIFQVSEGEQSPLFWILNKSSYTRIGVISLVRGKPYVLGVADVVRLLPLNEWLERGGNGKFIIKRLIDDDPITEENIKTMQQTIRPFLGKPYDKYYRWDDKSFYPAELVWKVYLGSFRVELTPAQKMDDLLVNYDNAREELSQIPKYTMNLNDKIVTIQGILKSKLLEVYYSPDELDYP